MSGNDKDLGIVRDANEVFDLVMGKRTASISKFTVNGISFYPAAGSDSDFIQAWRNMFGTFANGNMKAIFKILTELNYDELVVVVNCDKTLVYKRHTDAFGKTIFQRSSSMTVQVGKKYKDDHGETYEVLSVDGDDTEVKLSSGLTEPVFTDDIECDVEDGLWTEIS